MLKYIILLGMVVLLPNTTIAHGFPCASRSHTLKVLEEYGEVQIGRGSIAGNETMEFYSSGTGGSWSLVITSEDKKVSCLFIVGTNSAMLGEDSIAPTSEDKNL
jgi:hypothetical protein